MNEDPTREPGLDRDDPNAAEARGTAPSPLSSPVQEHLAQQLRAAYQEIADKPAFLGDPALPPQIEQHVSELEQRERTLLRDEAHRAAHAAVEAAMHDLVFEAVDSGHAPGQPPATEHDEP